MISRYTEKVTSCDDDEKCTKTVGKSCSRFIISILLHCCYLRFGSLFAAKVCTCRLHTERSYSDIFQGEKQIVVKTKQQNLVAKRKRNDNSEETCFECVINDFGGGGRREELMKNEWTWGEFLREREGDVLCVQFRELSSHSSVHAGKVTHKKLERFTSFSH